MRTGAFRFQLSAISRRARKTLVVAAAISVFSLQPSAFTAHCHAADAETTIVSETLEYFANLKKYIAKGSVKIEKEGSTIEADEIVFFEETGEVTAEGNIRYDDQQTFFTAKTAEMNIEKMTGKLHDADIFVKEDNYHLKGSVIERKGENEFYSRDETNFTTCDGPVPSWCFRGREMNLVVGQQVTGRDVSFRVKDVPVLYSPYLWVPVHTGRKTGFLLPTISSSSSRGVGVTIPYYWAISENRDATLVLDTYSKRGIGTGIEYRFVEPRGLSSAWWLYHIRDHELDRDFTEFRAVHDDRSSGGLGFFLNANFVNEKDFYREIKSHKDFYRDINPIKEKDLQRFLESTAEINVPLANARAYLLAQYWIDLKHETGDIAQKLPEIGFVLNYSRLGSIMISADASAVNFWRKDGSSVRRLSVNPRILHTSGNDVVFSQIAALRGTAYDFSHDAGFNSNNEKLAFEYDGNFHARFIKRYDSFTHVLEPSVRYHYISNSPNDLSYAFDEWELQGKTSRFELSLLNRINVKGSELVTARITQPVDMNNGDRPFRPLELELGTKQPLPAKISAAYDVNTGKVQSVTSEIRIPFTHGAVSFGQRYNMPENIMVFRAGVDIQPVKPIQVGMDVRYDANGEGMRSMAAYIQYSAKCWGIRIEAVKKPDDFTVQVKFDLFGVTSNPPKDL